MSSIQENGDGMHVLVFCCPDCGRNYRLVAGESMSPRVIADLICRATNPYR